MSSYLFFAFEGYYYTFTRETHVQYTLYCNNSLLTRFEERWTNLRAYLINNVLSNYVLYTIHCTFYIVNTV